MRGALFGSYRIDEIDIEEVEDYKRQKLADGVIGKAYINKTLTRLGQILDAAGHDERAYALPYH